MSFQHVRRDAWYCPWILCVRYSAWRLSSRRTLSLDLLTDRESMMTFIANYLLLFVVVVVVVSLWNKRKFKKSFKKVIFQCESVIGHLRRISTAFAWAVKPSTSAISFTIVAISLKFFSGKEIRLERFIKS